MLNPVNMPSICIIDDDDAVRDSLQILLESYGYVVRNYASARAFLADSQKPQSGPLLLDLHMPGMPGLELLEVLRVRGLGYKPIVITGRNDPVLEESARRAGAFKVLSKPLHSDALLEAITAAGQTAPVASAR